MRASSLARGERNAPSLRFGAVRREWLCLECDIFTDDPGAANDVSGVCGSLRQASLSPDKGGSSLCVQEQKTMFKLRLFRCKAKRACP